MRKMYLLLPVFIFLGVNVTSQTNKLTEIPSKLKKTLSQMKFIEGGTYTMGRHSDFMPTEKDSTLISFIIPYRTTVESFFISDHEVTNLEYKEFVSWVENSVKQKKKNEDPNYNLETKLNPVEYLYEYSLGNKIYLLNIYPDTSCWTKDFKYAFNEPLATQYFQHKAYNDYPVVGVSYIQAEAYCYWKTQMLNTLIKKVFGESTTLKAQVRLPKEEEWEFAAIEKTGEMGDIQHDIGLYPWNGYSFMGAKGTYMANFGAMFDENGVSIKSMIDDNGFHTVSVKSYFVNSNGLYQMAGNVSEWTSSKPEAAFTVAKNNDTLRFSYDDRYTLAYSKAYQFLYNISYPDTATAAGNQRIKDGAIRGVHDAQVIHRYSLGRIVKGGSWFNSLIYLQPGTKEVWYENRGSSRIGFRVAMDIFQ